GGQAIPALPQLEVLVQSIVHTPASQPPVHDGGQAPMPSGDGAPQPGSPSPSPGSPSPGSPSPGSPSPSPGSPSPSPGSPSPSPGSPSPSPSPACSSPTVSLDSSCSASLPLPPSSVESALVEKGFPTGTS